MFSQRILLYSSSASRGVLLNHTRRIRLPAAYQQFTIRTTAAMSTITDAIVKDHRELEQYYNEVINSNDPDHQERYQNQFTWELARHSVGEELVVYPSRDPVLHRQPERGPAPPGEAEHDRQEHHKVEPIPTHFTISMACT